MHHCALTLQAYNYITNMYVMHEWCKGYPFFFLCSLASLSGSSPTWCVKYQSWPSVWIQSVHVFVLLFMTANRMFLSLFMTASDYSNHELFVNKERLWLYFCSMLTPLSFHCMLSSQLSLYSHCTVYILCSFHQHSVCFHCCLNVRASSWVAIQLDFPFNFPL